MVERDGRGDLRITPEAIAAVLETGRMAPLLFHGLAALGLPVLGIALALKTWALGIAQRSTLRKARVALARRLAIIMHAMLRHGTPFQPA